MGPPYRISFERIRRGVDGVERWPVVIVGGGPAGLVLAWMLHRDGVPALLIERCDHASLGRQPKAGTMEQGIARALDREGLGPPLLDTTVENHRCQFRAPGTAVTIDYGALTGGAGHVVLPQHRLVRAIADDLVGAGAAVWFGHELLEVRPAEPAVVVAGPDGTSREVRAEVLVGADGAGSAVATALGSAGASAQDRWLPGRWLVMTAPAPPLVGHTIYATHPHGFAAHLRRGPAETRYYLEVPAGEGPQDWPVDALRAELDDRLAADGALADLDITEVGVLDLRTRVVAPMQRGPVLLAGDAAHLITPAGGKGMNLAIGDAVELAHGLAERFGPAGDGSRLAAYSATRSPAIWRAQAFSDWHLRILSAHSVGDGSAFSDGLRAGWVAALRDDPLLARWFAHAYAGVDPVT